jgi:hypothetical protein
MFSALLPFHHCEAPASSKENSEGDVLTEEAVSGLAAKTLEAAQKKMLIVIAKNWLREFKM